MKEERMAEGIDGGERVSKEELGGGCDWKRGKRNRMHGQ